MNTHEKDHHQDSGHCCGGDEDKKPSDQTSPRSISLNVASPPPQFPDHMHGDDDGDATDPVCGMRVDPASAAGAAEYGGDTYYFCSTGCRAKFVQDPERYL
ncbi:MAG: YHS domain-containing protein, partial [Phycisphaeraceae bacterium]